MWWGALTFVACWPYVATIFTCTLQKAFTIRGGLLEENNPEGTKALCGLCGLLEGSDMSLRRNHNCSTKCLNQDGPVSKTPILAPLTSISFRISGGVRIIENNGAACLYEILHDQFFQCSAPVSVINKSSFPSCANFQIPINFSEAFLDLLTGQPFEFVKIVYNHVLSWKWKARSMWYGGPLIWLGCSHTEIHDITHT